MRLEIGQFQGLQQRLEQRLKLAPQIIQSIEILQLPLLELDRLIKQELEENPVLELAETEESPEETKEEAAPAPAQVAETERPTGEFERLADLEGEWPDYFHQGRPERGGDEKDKKIEAMQNTAAKPASLQDYLFEQLSLLEVTPREREIGEKIIFNIDDNGYFPYRLEDIFDPAAAGPAFSEARKVLSMVQGLDPPGVGGHDLSEVLLLQLDPNDADLMVKEALIRNHLDDIRKNRLPRIARDMGLPLEEVKRLVGEVSLLNPRPGALHNNEAPQYIIPDVVVELVDGEYVIRLEDRYTPSLRISGKYWRLLQDKSGDRPTRDFIKKKIDSARWLIDSIEQRKNTLLRVAVEIFRHQRAFLDHGLTHLKPLKMQTIADAVSIHVSTVSRAIYEKYVQTHRGIYPLKYFFSGGTASTEGEDLSRVTVKNRVKEIIDGENGRTPLSDEEISDHLLKTGLNVARRTVTKYRKMLGIPSSRQRRVY